MQPKRKRNISIVKNGALILFTPFFLSSIATLLYFQLFDNYIAWWLLSKAISVAALIAMVIGIPALAICVGNKVTALESYKYAARIIHNFLITYFLYAILVLGGTAFFLIPGLIFAVRYVFSPYVAIFENKRGFSALRRSNEIANKVWWKVFFSILAVAAVFVIQYLVEQFILDLESISGLLMYSATSIAITVIVWLIFLRIYLNNRGTGEENDDVHVSLLGKILMVPPFIVGSLLMLLTMVMLFNVSFRDYDPPFDDSHIRIEPANTTQENNLLFFLEDNFSYDITSSGGCRPENENLLNNILDNEYGSYIEFIRSNPEESAVAIAQLERPRECLEEMASYTHYTTNYKLDDRPSYFALINILKYNLFYASYSSHTGDTKEALDTIMQILSIGKIMSENPNQDSIDILFAIGVQDIALETIIDIDPALPSNEAVLYSERLSEVELSIDSIETVLYLEYTMVSEMIEDPENSSILQSSSMDLYDMWPIGDTRSTYFYKPNKTKKELAATNEMLVQYAREYDIDALDEIHNKSLWYEPSWHDVLKRDNIAGEIIQNSQITAIPATGITEEVYENLYINRALRLSLAINSYQLGNGQLPDTLDDLTPDHISDIPEDPYTDGFDTRYSKSDGIQI